MKMAAGEFRTVYKNFLNLAVVQGLTLLLPLITTPYIIRKIGLENVGIVALATAITGYFGILINYGFNLSATRQIAVSNTDRLAVSRIFCGVFYAKIFLIVLSVIIFAGLVVFNSAISKYFWLYASLFSSVVFTNLSAEWFFQGMQDLRDFTKANIIAKLLSALLIFLIIQKPDDVILMGIFPLVSSSLVFFWSQWHIYKKFEISWVKFSFRDIFRELHATRFIFLSQVKVSFFNSFNILVLGAIVTNAMVGIYSSAEKIVRLFTAVQVPAVNALFPHFANEVHRNKKIAWRKINKIALMGSAMYIVALSVLFFAADIIAKIMFGTHVFEISTVIRILSVTPLFIFVNNLYGTQFLLHLKKDKVFFGILLTAAFFNVIVCPLLSHFFAQNGTAVAVVLTEGVVLLGMFLFARKFSAG